MKKKYYRVISITPTFTDYVWHCSHDTVLTLNCDFIIPLDRKPRGVAILEGK